MLSTNTTAEERLRLKEITAHEFYQVLTEQQQCFVVKYLASGLMSGTYDAVEACRVAYPNCKNAKNTASQACQLLGNKRIRKVLDLHFRHSELDSLLTDLHIAIKKSIRRDKGLSPDTTRAIELFEKHSGTKFDAEKRNPRG